MEKGNNLNGCCFSCYRSCKLLLQLLFMLPSLQAAAAAQSLEAFYTQAHFNVYQPDVVDLLDWVISFKWKKAVSLFFQRL